MTHPNSSQLQEALDNWQYFSPCLGTNVTIFDSKNGFWNSASGFSKPNQILEADQQFYIYSITNFFTPDIALD